MPKLEYLMTFKADLKPPVDVGGGPSGTRQIYDVTGGSNDPALLGGPAGIWVDPETNEVYVADGYRNRRVVVYDGETPRPHSYGC